MKKKTNISTAEIENIIGYKFKDRSLLVQAFTRTSFCNEQAAGGGVKTQSNEVLEFFGDTVLSAAIITFLLGECTERYKYGIKTELGEGDFSNIKSKLSDKQNLSKSIKNLGLQKHLLMGEGDLKLGVQDEPSVMEDLFESIVGAVYIDSEMNMDSVIKVVSAMLDMSVYTSKEKTIQSSKNALQEWCADKKRRLPAPRYETLSEDGPDHKKTYLRGCYIGERLVGRGIGKNFKIADAAAADDALQVLKAENDYVLTTNVIKNTDTDSKAPGAPAKAKIKSMQSKKASQAENERSGEQKKSAESKPKSEVSASEKLRALVASRKLPSPTYKDLGEIKAGTKSECRVECSMGDISVTGIGDTRRSAREDATSKLLSSIMGKEKPKAKEKPKLQGGPENARGKTSKKQKKPAARTAKKITDSAKSTKSDTKKITPEASKPTAKGSSKRRHAFPRQKKATQK